MDITSVPGPLGVNIYLIGRHMMEMWQADMSPDFLNAVPGSFQGLFSSGTKQNGKLKQGSCAVSP